MPPSSYDLAEHRHRFAVWAAARAAQRGFTTVAPLRDALESTSIRTTLASESTRDVSRSSFDDLHRQWCASICAHLNGALVGNVTYGRAAKLVAVYLKAIVLMGAECDSSLGHHMHPPIDRILLQALAASPRISSPHQAQWRKVAWTQLQDAGYYQLIDQLRAALPPEVPFWMLEEYWQPSEPAEEG
jgi:hypothetical protein